VAVFGSGIARSPHPSDGLAAVYLLAFLNQQFRVMSVKRAQAVAMIQNDGFAIIAHGGAEKHPPGAYGQHFLASLAADIHPGMAVAAAAFPEVGKNLTPWNGPGPGQGSSSWDEDPLVDVQLVGIAKVVDPDELLDRDAVVSGDPVQGLTWLYDVKEPGTLLLVCGALI